MRRRVLITGGSSGIGAAMVRTFARAGYRVVFTYRSGRSRATALLRALQDCDVTALPFEQGDWASHGALIKALPFPIDVLINNAALGSATVEQVASRRPAQDLALLQVNAAGPLWLCEALRPGMRKRKWGKIINLSSVGGGISQFPKFRLADTMSKAAVAALTRQLALEEIHSAVDVYAICPGATDTAMFQASTLKQMTVAQRRRFEKALPKGRLIRPTEIAQLAMFLCSDAGQVLHGAVLDASLGLGVGAPLPAPGP